MLGIPISQTQLQDALTAFFNIGAAGTLLMVVLALGLSGTLIQALRAVFGRVG